MKKYPLKINEQTAFKIKKLKISEEKIAKHWDTILNKIKNKKGNE